MEAAPACIPVGKAPAHPFAGPVGAAPAGTEESSPDVDGDWGCDGDDGDDDDDVAAAIADLHIRRKWGPGDATSADDIGIPGGADDGEVHADLVAWADAFVRRRALSGQVLPLAAVYAELAECVSFGDVLRRARAFAREDPTDAASAVSQAWADDAPGERVSIARASADAHAARERGLMAVLEERNAALAPITVQRDIMLEPEGPPVAGFPRVPPHPTPVVWDAVRSLAGGAPLLLPEGCPEATHAAPRAARAPLVELATERLLAEDCALGMAMVLPYHAGVAEFERAGVPLRLSRDHIAAKALSPKGRLVVHFKETNAPSKKPLLAATYGAMKGAMPTLADYCQLAVSSIAHFAARGETDLVISKSDCSEWFKRVSLLPRDCGQLAYTVWIDGEQYLVVPGVNQFGSQDSGYQSLALTAVIAANDRNDDVAQFGVPVSLMFADDDAAFLPSRHVDGRRARHAGRVHELVGARGLNKKKNRDDAVNTVIGYEFNLPRRDVALSCTRFLKFINVVFFELPVALQPGDRVRVNQLERAASYMMQAAALTVAGRSACHAAYRNVSRIPLEQRFVSLTADTVSDINVWRGILVLACADARCLTVPLSVPPSVRRSRDETRVDWASRMAAAASLVINSDAAGKGWSVPGTFGCGFTARARRAGYPASVMPPVLYGSFEVPYVEGYSPFRDPAKIDGDINLYEFLTAVIALDALLTALPALRAAGCVDPAAPPDPDAAPGAAPPPLRVHCWTDNTSALAWLNTFKANSVLHSFVLQVWGALQARHNVLATSGHIPGSQNHLGDSPSRGFRGTTGAQMRQYLSGVQRTPQLPLWLENLRATATSSSSITWPAAANLLTTLA